MNKLILLITILLSNLSANNLINEESPYLQQHAHNPVNWYPWSEKAFQKAEDENKLIFLSIGYSTCHWCHVMEKESFENEAIAEQLNRDFISIKVDREEYPHIDKYYQSIFRVMNNRSGGWPLTIIMTPQKKVFFSDSYIPATPKYGHQGLKKVLKMIVEIFQKQPNDILKDAKSIESMVNQNLKVQQSNKKELNKNIEKLFIAQVKSNYDKENKGVGSAPKFPHATTLLTLLHIYEKSKNEEALKLATEALTAMGRGGIYDQIEGGFFRYAVDMTWTIPHFEKMLYTNAELIESYALAYKLTHDKFYKKIIEMTIQNISERFKEENLYYSASDADSDGEEGKYFLFKYPKALKDLQENGFSAKEAESVLEYLSITEFGNFEGYKSNPRLDEYSVYPLKFREAIKILRANREKKSYPFIDKKIQTSWNSIFIYSLFKAKDVNKKYAQQAFTSLDALIENLYLNNKLYHQLLLGKKPKVEAYLEDYAFLISALIEAHQISLEKKYLTLATKLSKEAITKFYKNNYWKMSNDDFKTKADLYDSSYRSALAVMLENLLKIGLLNGDYKSYNLAKESLENQAESLNSIPSAFPYASSLLLMLESDPIVIKSNRENLKRCKERLKEIEYDDIFFKVIEDKNFLACSMGLCFATEESIDGLIKKIEKYKNGK